MVQFNRLDQKWYEALFTSYFEDTNIKLSNITTPPVIDLSSINYLTFSELINLFLSIDYFSSNFKNIQLMFYGLGPYTKDRIMSIDEYNYLRNNNDEATKNSPQYKTAENVYRFLSYLNHFGFFNSLSRARSLGKITLVGLTDSILSNLYEYSGIGNKIMPLLPIYNTNEVSEFMYENSINTWISNLPSSYKNHPIFREGEFSRVFGYQLAYNIIEHSNNSNIRATDDIGALGAICMQLITNDKYSYLKNNYPSDSHELFSSENSGILEICVGDRGVGIFNTLQKRFIELYEKIGNDKKQVREDILIKDVISFAFDEIGSRKTLEQRIGGVHALHRILKSTAKYGGILRLKSNGYEFTYNCFLNNLTRGSDGFGFRPNLIEKCSYPYFGVQYQILIPLKTKNYSTKSIPLKKSIFETEKLHSKLKAIIVPLEAFFKTDEEYSDYNKILKHSGFVNITNSLFEEPHDSIIVYNFYGREWSENEIALILMSQKAILHTKYCIGINLPNGLPSILRERERHKVDEPRKALTGDTNFFDILSSKHRLLPLFDIENNLYWIGLSNYDFDDVLSLSYLREDNSISNDDIFYKGNPDEENDICRLYLNTNNQIFAYISSYWKSRLSMGLYKEILKQAIKENFSLILHDLKCILEKENQKYILPSSKKLTNKFVKTINLFQNNPSANQISRWFANAILNKLVLTEDKILIVTSTAPSELLSQIISNALFPKRVYILNLGYYSVFEEEILYSTKDWQDIPLFIITDVIDKGESIEEIKEKLHKNNLKIRGVLTLFQFVDDIDEEIRIVTDWFDAKKTVPNISYFVFAQMKRPQNFEWTESSINDKISIIEPFSLKDFELSDLANIDVNIDRLKLLSEESLLREGHWVYEQHHFSVTVCIQELFLNSTISGQICQDILGIIRKDNINLLIIPLHSHIRDFIPTILLYTKLFLGINLEYYYCISTKALSEKPFYILPQELEDQLKNESKEFNILIVDDAVATGRTQETIIRALILASKNNINAKINHLKIYSVISRLGRAKDTFWSCINELTLSPNRTTQFSFQKWITLDMPVFEKEDCPLCKEINQLNSLRQSIEFQHAERLIDEIDNRIEQLTPHSTESPTFIKPPSPESTFKEPVNIGNEEAKTLEFALWQFNNLLYRGYPFIYLIEELINFSKKNDPNLLDLQNKICKILISKWERISSLYAENKLKEFIIEELNKGSIISKNILSYIGEKLPEIKSKESRELIDEIIDIAIRKIKDFSDNNLLNSRENLTIGISLFFAFYIKNIPNILDKERRKEELSYIKEIKYKIKNISEEKSLNSYTRLCYKNIEYWTSRLIPKESFLSALIVVLDNTIRASRPNSHPFLLPKLIYLLSKT